ITLQAPNPFVNVPAMSSPAHRFQVVTTPVTYYCNGRTRGGDGTLVRISNYGIVPVQADPPEVNNQLKAILAKNVLDCSFDYTSLPNTHSALIGMTIILQRPDSTAEGSVTLHHQIHVDNTP
ncbi:MAG TPA: prepilin-type cleavage/methylation domain-containing protein, partial [Janthinobacterium sp.]|nr:prepilin-type cleavage/methylation domain-containing protein [Janthinobacterium sp.]